MKYIIKRAGIVVASIAFEGQQIRKSLGEDVVDVSFKSKTPVDIQIEDTVEVYGRVYKLNRPLESTVSNGIYQYSGQFEALWYDLIDVQFRGLGATNQLTEAEFSIYATAYDIVDLAVRNANRIQIGWTIGVVDDTERYNFTFHGQNVKQALNQLVEVFQSEIWFDNKTIHFQKREVNSGLSLSYGKGNGLYEFTKANRTDTSVVTRLYVEGGSRNLPQGYGRTRLQLPGGMPYIQDADITKIIEHSEHFDNIIPERIGTITNVVDPFTFTDTSMDFDVNDHLGGMKAKIGFQTGKLAGIEFELASYVHATKTFKIILNTTDKAWPNGLPNDDLKPEVGDKYTVFDINLPSSYITDAENRLLAAGQQYYDRYKYTQHEFGVRLTPLWVKQQSPAIELGHTVRVVDANLGIDKTTRIAAYTRDLQNEYQYDVDLSDELTIAEVVRQFAQQERILYAIQTAGLLDPEQMRKNLFLNRLSENDGYLFLGSEKVKAGLSDYASVAGHANTADYAYDADKWDGYQFGDFLNQPVRTVDSPIFQAVTANELNALQSLMIPQIANAASQALWKSGGYLMMGTNKAWSGNSDLWNGLAQPDYVTQPVRPGDSPKFTGLSSPSFASGFSGHGFRMVQDGNGDYILELDRLSVRKDFTVHELIVNKIRATNGSLWVSDAAKLTNAYASGGGYICTIDTDGGAITVPFVVGDIVRCQVFNGTSIKYYTAQVTSVGAGDFAISIIEGADIPDIGDEIVRIGNVSNSNRQGALYLTSSDSGSPYLDVVDGVNSSSLAGKTKARLGKLDGIVDPDFGALSGYGLYAQNGFFKGVVRVGNGSNVYTMDQTDAAIDAIEVGGRNLLRNSKQPDFGLYEQTTGKVLKLYKAQYPEIESDLTYIRVTGGASSYANMRALLSVGTPKSGELVSLSFKVRNFKDPITLVSNQGGRETTINVNNQTTLVKWEGIEGNGYGFVQIQIRSLSTDLELYVWDVMYEKGNKATDWTPAPEDVQAEINTLRTETYTEFSVLEGQISLKASQSEVNGLTSRISSAELEIDGLQGEIALKATQSEVNAIDGRLSAAEVKITPEAINLTVSSQITDKVNAIEVGGRNLFKKTSVFRPLVGNANPTHNLLNGIQVQPSFPGLNTFRVLNVTNPKGVYTVSFEVKADISGSTMGTDINDVGGNLNNEIAITTEWQKYVKTSTSNMSEAVYNFVDFNFQISGNPLIQIRNLKIEKGNKATDWTPAPEDVQADIDLRPTEAEIKSSFIMTSNSISLLGQSIDMTGKVTFNSLDGDTQGSINTALSNANNANSNLSALQLSLGAMAYENVVGLAKLDSTVIDGGYIRTALLDVESIFAQDITATGLITAKNLTVTENSKIGGFNVTKSNGDLADEYNRLENRNAKTSLIFENLGDASTYLRINRSQSDPILAIGTSQVGRTGLSIQTFANGATGLYILNNVSGGTGKAIASYGNHEFYTRPGETWNAPGVLAIMEINLFSGSISNKWSISTIDPTSAKMSSDINVTHNLGHTDYTVMLSTEKWDIDVRLSEKTSSSFKIQSPSIGSVGARVVWALMVGRNKI